MNRVYRFSGIVLLWLGLWPAVALSLPEPIAPGQADLFAQALAVARKEQWANLELLEKQLGKDFPLQGYLDYQRLRARLPAASAKEVLAYAHRYEDSPLADSMRRLAIERYGQQGNAKALLAVSPTEPASTGLRCYYQQALLSQGDVRAEQAGRALWLYGDSLPAACDVLFSRLKASGIIDDELIWQRMVLAYRSGSPGLMRYLRSELKSSSWQVTADTLLSLYQSPAKAKDMLPGRGHATMAKAALYRLAEKDPIQAVALLPEVGNRFFFSEDEMAELRYRAAWFSSVRELPANRAWLDSYLETSADPRLLEHRIRRAVTEQDWPAVAYWIERLPAGQQGARWHYWRARALEGLYQPAAAQPYFIQAAAERSFWGFLAAQRLGLPPSLNNEPLPLGLQQPLNAAGDALLQRVGLLLAVGERGHARGEWLFYLRKEQNPAQRDALASAAVAAGWPDLAIEAALQTHQSNKLDWRFPLAYDGQFAAAEEKHRVDRWLLMALARRESAFNPQASSPAGAQGLMQLMPGTARQMAGKAGMPFGNVAVLHDPAINIELGSQYLAGLLTRYQGNRVLALAAYNAGPSRVDRWLKDANDPMDVFIESIPFYETREYVQAVLAYRVIFSRHRDGSALLALLNESEMIAPYNEQWLAEAGRPGRVGPPPI